jgi:HK97 family phage major capsid protein
MTFTLIPFLVALIVGIELTNGFHASYKVAQRQTGFSKVAPWLHRISAALTSARSAWVAGLLSFLRARPQLGAAALVMAVTLAYPGEAFAGVALIGVAGQLNVVQLETDLRQKTAAAKTLLENTMRTCEDTVVTPASADGRTPEVKGRKMTAEERGAVQKILDEAKGIKARIDDTKADANLTAEIERLTAGMTSGGGAHAHQPVRDARSLGAQLVGDAGYRDWIKAGGPRRNGHWSSPAVELNDVRAATFTTDTASGGSLVQPDVQPGFIPLMFRRLVVADLVAPGTTDGNLIAFVKELAFTNAAAAVAEGGAKPESTITFEPATAAVKKIAHWMAVTREMLEDYAQTQSIIDGRLRLGLDLVKDDQLLNGNGVGANQLGLMQLPGLAAAIARGADTNADVVMRQISAISIATFLVPDAFVMNPANWLTIQLTKNAAGNYLGSGPWAPAQPAQLWGLPGAITPAIVANTALIGAYRAAAQYFRKGGVTVEMTNSHADFFIKNLVAILAEERGALAVYRQSAFGKVTGLN